MENLIAWISFGFGTFFILLGLFVFGLATYGVFKFNYVLNRAHVAAKMDTLASLLIFTGLMFYSGFTFATLKILFLMMFLWLTNPVGSHFVAEIEVKTNDAYNDMVKEEL